MQVKVSTTEVTDVATAVKLDQETASIEIGKTIQLKAEVTPGTALQQGTWKSSNEAVAKVNEAGLCYSSSKEVKLRLHLQQQMAQIFQLNVRLQLQQRQSQ